MRFLIALAVFVLLSVPAQAQDRSLLGIGRLFTNDMIGEGRDRWRTGSWALSIVRGPAWTGELPRRPGALLEYRLRSEIITPSRVRNPPPGDRRFAGILSVGAHTHWQNGAADFSLGLDLVATGPMTGMDEVQDAIHRTFSLPRPNIYGNQIGNGIHPTVTAEMGTRFGRPGLSIRPFAEVSAGVETYVRAGFDAMVGMPGQNDLMIRDVSSGQRYRGTFGAAEGYSFTFGADFAKVFDSVYLPSDQGYELTDHRNRIRAGVHWQRGTTGIFYGVTWLGPEFVGQPEGQLVGSLRLKILF